MTKGSFGWLARECSPKCKYQRPAVGIDDDVAKLNLPAEDQNP
jgi:hypothetical protein